MTLQATIKVADIQVRGPYQNKKTGGEYDVHVLKDAEGREFTKFANAGTPPENTVGETLEIFYNESQDTRGNTRRLIETPRKQSTNTSNYSKKPFFNKPATSTYDSKGARTGMIIKAGLDLALKVAEFNKSKEITAFQLADATDLIRAEVKRVEDLENKVS